MRKSGISVPDKGADDLPSSRRTPGPPVGPGVCFFGHEACSLAKRNSSAPNPLRVCVFVANHANANGRTNMRAKLLLAALLAAAAGPPALAQNQDAGGIPTETQRRLAQGDAAIPWDLLG